MTVNAVNCNPWDVCFQMSTLQTIAAMIAVVVAILLFLILMALAVPYMQSVLNPKRQSETKRILINGTGLYRKNMTRTNHLTAGTKYQSIKYTNYELV